MKQIKKKNIDLEQHEYGHTFDSHRFGPFYLGKIGIKSATGDEETELRANRHAKRYFETNYGINWDIYRSISYLT